MRNNHKTGFESVNTADVEKKIYNCARKGGRHFRCGIALLYFDNSKRTHEREYRVYT